jgi:hypothetical protein
LFEISPFPTVMALYGAALGTLYTWRIDGGFIFIFIAGGNLCQAEDITISRFAPMLYQVMIYPSNVPVYSGHSLCRPCGREKHLHQITSPQSSVLVNPRTASSRSARYASLL